MVAVAAAASSYVVTDLGTPSGPGTYSWPHAMNQAGWVAGEWGGAFTQNAFLYENGENSNVLLNAVAYGVNNTGVVVGKTGLAYTHGFSWSNGVSTDLGTLAGTYSVAWAINNSGGDVGITGCSA